LDDRREGAELDLTNTNFTKTEFDSVVVEVKSFEVTESSSLSDLVFEVLLNGGDVFKLKTVCVDEQGNGIDWGSLEIGGERSGGVPIKKLFPSVFFDKV